MAQAPPPYPSQQGVPPYPSQQGVPPYPTQQGAPPYPTQPPGYPSQGAPPYPPQSGYGAPGPAAYSDPKLPTHQVSLTNYQLFFYMFLRNDSSNMNH